MVQLRGSAAAAAEAMTRSADVGVSARALGGTAGPTARIRARRSSDAWCISERPASATTTNSSRAAGREPSQCACAPHAPLRGNAAYALRGRASPRR
eukprot:CAMPEP_0117611934 /NCGR_PEP_ID=MMETSP0784-20121206/82668_1 /TAXON_ID=39447 /ORGANISM="" /LENGTH=96 /DNA_ID=CAMNT_0005415431 /DNA_START=194 /DNA_END=480 /DNA_ORIENTATION=-